MQLIHMNMKITTEILPAIHEWNHDPKRISDGKLVEPNFSYCSDNNKDWMSIESPKRMDKKLNKDKIGKI